MLIDRAPIALSERLRAAALLAKRMIRQRGLLNLELGFLIRHLTGRPYPVLGSIQRFNRPGPGSAP